MPLLATSAPLVQWRRPQDTPRRCHGTDVTKTSRDSLVAQDALRRRSLRVLHLPTSVPRHSTSQLPLAIHASRPWRFQSVALSVFFATKPRLGVFSPASLSLAGSSSGCPCRTPQEIPKPPIGLVCDKPCVFSLTGLPCLQPSVKPPTASQLPDAFLGSYRPCGIWNEPTLLNKRIPESQLITLRQISTGAFGDVLLGQYDGRRVAVKRLAYDHQTKRDALTFASEIARMAQLDHPNIVAFVGVEWSKQWLVQAVSDFVEGADLRSLLDAESSAACACLTWANAKCQMAIDVANALAYLHELSPLVTMEVLQAHNVLLEKDLSTAKLSLFAVTRARSVFATDGADASYRWMAPEVARGEPLTELSVIYSFGVLLCELDSCEIPFYDTVNPNGKPMSSFKIMLLVSRGDLRPTLTSECPESIASLASECLSGDPSQRPTAASIAYRLRAIFKNEL